MSTDTPAAAPTAEREAFEKWAVLQMPPHKLERAPAPFAYEWASTAGAWKAWLARAALSAPVAAQPAVAAPTKQGRALPNPGSPEASAMLDSLLAEYNWPANSKNAARAGWEAANRWLAAAPAAQPADTAKLADIARECGAETGAWPTPADVLWVKFHSMDALAAFAQRLQPSAPAAQPAARSIVEQAAIAAGLPMGPRVGEYPVAYANGDELDNMLDDRTATIAGVRDGWRKTPLYRYPMPGTTEAERKDLAERRQ